MDEQTFWALIDKLDHDPAALDRLVKTRDFADHLARVLHALDTPAHFQAAEHSADFLGVRCAAIAAGPTTYRAVLQSPTALAAFATCPAGSFPASALTLQRLTTTIHAAPHHASQPLHTAPPLTAPPLTAPPLTAPPHAPSPHAAPPHMSPTAIAAGSNQVAWGTHWLRPHLGTTAVTGSTPEAYLVALQHLALALDTDPAWQRWWRRTGLPECELGIVAEDYLDHLRPSADIRQTGDRLRANFTCAAPPADVAALPLATAELTAMLEVVREALGLGELPPLPQLRELPPAPYDVRVTTKRVPTVTSEMEERGYLTLAQIQEFFG